MNRPAFLPCTKAEVILWRTGILFVLNLPNIFSQKIYKAFGKIELYLMIRLGGTWEFLKRGRDRNFTFHLKWIQKSQVMLS